MSLAPADTQTAIPWPNPQAPKAKSVEVSPEITAHSSALGVVGGWVHMTTEKWGWSLARVERITLSKGRQRNVYYGLKILGVKILIWHWSFDGHAPNHPLT